MFQINFHLAKVLYRKAFFVSLILAAFVSGATLVHSAGDSTGPTKMLSVNTTGMASGNEGCDIKGISANGRYVLFTSIATDLVPNDTNGVLSDIFVRDTQMNITTLVSVNNTGTGSGDLPSYSPSMSPDGRYVVFVSFSTDLVPLNPGHGSEVYLRDLQAATTRLVSITPSGLSGGNGTSSSPFVSANGRYVAFQSTANDLGPPDSNVTADIYVRDMQANSTMLVSINTTGTDSGNATSGSLSTSPNGLSITPDGRYVVFHSKASNLVLLPDNNFGLTDVFVRDLQAGTTTLVSVNSAGTGSGNFPSETTTITPNGRYVVFLSQATNLTTNDANGMVRDVFMRDLQAGVTTLVSVNNAGASGNSNSTANGGERVVVSADGRYVAFQSGASNFFPNDNNDLPDIFVRDIQSGVTRLASINSAGTAPGNSSSYLPKISEDGRFVGFLSYASNLTTIPDTNNLLDIYVRDMQKGRTALASINALGTAAGNSESINLRISASGHYLAFSSFASNLTTTADLNGTADVFLFFNRAKGPTQGDFDGDGKTDLSVFRPANGTWYILQSSNDAFVARQFGLGTDRLVPGDYDNDGKSDLAVFRNGDWFVLQSTNGLTLTRHLGSGGDLPAPADYDNDGKTDFAVFRPTTGVWYIERSSDFGLIIQSFGASGDLPVPGDYNGDGSADIAVWRPSNGTWYTSLSPGTNYGAVRFGLSGDKPVQADYDGDGKTDVAVYRPGTGTWYLLTSTNGFQSELFGIATDVAVAADYDGDGQSDVAVFRSGDWHIRASAGNARASSAEAFDQTIHWGQAGDKAVPAAFVPEQ